MFPAMIWHIMTQLNRLQNISERPIVRGATIALLGIAVAGGLTACGDEAPIHCGYQAVIGDGGSTGPEEAILYSMKTDAGIVNYKGYSGVHDTGGIVRARLLSQHKRYLEPMAGDTFGFCIQDKHVTPNPAMPPVANDK